LLKSDELLANLVYGDQATFRSDASWICSPSLNWTLLTTRVSRSNPLSRFQLFWAD